MIAISSENGFLLRRFGADSVGEVLGFHALFGFIGEENAAARQKARAQRGLQARGEGWRFRFRILKNDGKSWAPMALEGCTAERLAEAQWRLTTSYGNYLISEQAELDPQLLSPAPRPSDKILKIGFAIALVIALAIPFLSPKVDTAVEEVKLPEPVAVQLKVEQKPVQVTQAEKVIDKLVAKPELMKEQKVKRAIQNNLGFLGLLGRKDLKKALGGAPTMKDASAGAGAGGLAGSGGETLVGLGEGLSRTTVGNTGVKGLGGIGTKGAGGGAGGYGNSSVGSGEGKALTSMPMTGDMVLEGGLDRSVIAATVAKYLSQVRACYERGLEAQPGIGGQVSMHFEIGPAGNVAAAHVVRSSLGSSLVEQCITSRMLGWQFPKPLGGVVVKVNYPFLLRPSGS